MPTLQPCPVCLGYSPERANCPQCSGSGLGSIFSKAVKAVKKVVKKTIAKAQTPKGALELGAGIMTGGASTAVTAAAGREATQEVAGAISQKITAKGVDHAAARRMADAIAAASKNLTPEQVEDAARIAAEKYAAGGGLMKVGLGAGAAVLALGVVGAFYFATRRKKVKEEGR